MAIAPADPSSLALADVIMARKSFARFAEAAPVPNLIQIQRDSFSWFKREGLRELFDEISPIGDFTGRTMELELAVPGPDGEPGYEFGDPKLAEDECRLRDQTYAAPLRVRMRLRIKSGDAEGELKEQTIFMGDFPLMTENGTFIINGAERVVVSQLVRSPGVYFAANEDTSSGRPLATAKLIPSRGAWLEFETSSRDVLSVKVDRKRKIPVTTLIRALGAVPGSPIKKGDNEEMLALYEADDNHRDHHYLQSTMDKDPASTTQEALLEFYRRLRPGDPPNLDNARQLLNSLFFSFRRYDLGRVGRYKLSRRLRIEQTDYKTDRGLPPTHRIEFVREMIRINNERSSRDDIDHLGNRRVRAVGELIQNQFRVGLLRMERVVKERMSITEPATATPSSLVNIRPVVAAMREFFGGSQLSQFMDQVNPLAELTHKRRLSALGPGGLSRDRAGFEVRDVHPSHYGRICPVETPEGPNIGLIASLATFARVNDFGFIETPYRKVEKGRVTGHLDYLTADREETFIVAQANAPIDEKGNYTQDRVMCRSKGDFVDVEPQRVDYMDVSPKQLVSVAAGLIPFLEHDDANRALMGSNMQRQAVPLLVTEAPLVATGLEERVARDSRAVIVAEEASKVASVTGSQIIITDNGHLPDTKKKIKHDPEKGVYVYQVRKFMRSNAATCINQKILVEKGDSIKKGQVLADGPCTQGGELALGRNVLCAFMPWNGYNFEDAILISERIVKEDIFTSIHIDEFEVSARDTKLGPEEITRDIPNLGDEALKNLGPDGVIRVGAEVKPGDILVGKITPKSETELAPEERLLRAIFGEKAADVKDSSLKVPSGTYGIVMDVKVSSKKEKDLDRDKPPVAGDAKKAAKQVQEDYKAKSDELHEQLTEALSNILLGEKIPLDVVNSETGEIIIPANRKITKTLLRKLAGVYDRIEIDPSPIRNKINEIIAGFKKKFDDLQMQYDEEIERAESGEGVDSGVVKSVKVYIASKRKLSVGDKMAGRHGNKGVVAKIVAEEDMPFLADGTPVEIVLNPLGVPSRMNVGQVLETHLGWAARLLGLRFATPVFDGIKEKEIRGYLREAKLPEHGKTRLYDGRSGEPFDQEIVVGFIYMMKLGHLVADKIHARAVGPYSLVTQQPLGGKAQYGGQRFGEMEVWAMEAYGAAYTLQELLTVKSDDVQGRTRIYESIVKGDNCLEAGIPESFNVLVKEMQSLGMDVKVGYSNPLEQPAQPPTALTNLG